MFNIRKLDLNLLAAFDALFDERSVTRAAERLTLTQPTVSGMLQRLRHMFSDELFIRTSHGVLPTPRADTLAGPIKALLANAQALVTENIFNPAETEGTFRLCASDYMQHAAAIPFVHTVRKSAPRLKALISPRPVSGVTDMMARGEMDICICSPESAEPDLPSRLLYRDRYVCVVRKSHPIKSKQVSIEELCSYDHLLVDPSGRQLWGPVDDVLTGLGYRRQIAAAVPSFHVLFELLHSDNFIAFVPERLLRNRLARTRTLETPLDIPALEVIAYWHPRMNEDARHKWLRDTLASVTRTTK